MRKNNCQIGFDDRWVMLIAIPVLSFIIPIVFMGCRFNRYPLFSWDKYITTFVITTVLWIGNRYILIYCRKKYPDLKMYANGFLFRVYVCLCLQ